MIYTARAARTVSRLHDYYEEMGRPAAAAKLRAAIAQAERRIKQSPEDGLRATRPYPALARAGRAWIKAERYWFCYTLEEPPKITAVFFETRTFQTAYKHQGVANT